MVCRRIQYGPGRADDIRSHLGLVQGATAVGHRRVLLWSAAGEVTQILAFHKNQVLIGWRAEWAIGNDP